MINGLIKKVLIITSEPFPHGMAGTNRIISFGKGFIANGLDIQVLSMFKYGEPDDIIINPTKGVYEGIKFANIFNSTVKNRYKIIRVFNECCKSVLVFHYCLKTLNRDTFVLYYSPESLPAILIKIVTYIKGLVFVKEETEHPLVRLKGKTKLFKYLYIKCHYRIFDGLFVITHYLYTYFKDELNYKKLVLIVPMIVDVDRFNHTISTNNKRIVFSGALDDQKEGVDILIRAFYNVLKIHPDYTLDLYGRAIDNTMVNRYKEMISDLKIEKNVIMHGYKIRDELTEILLQADILVFTRPPSLRATYGFSTKLGEYLAAGKPIVVTRVGEIERFLKDRKNAFICDPNEDSIAGKICEIIEDYDFALRVGKEGRLCVLEYFNNKVETKKIIDQIQVFFN